MPGTYRYSATFDKPYVEEESSLPSRSPVRFSIGSWQGANAPAAAIENLAPLSSSLRHDARSASTDSLESNSCGSSTGSSAGHSRQVSIDGMECIPTRTSKATPASVAAHNPLQFVKVGPVPLYKKAEEQIKLVKETKISRDKIKENEEAWQSNLDVWKNRRRKLSEKSIQRLEEMKMIQEEEQLRQKSTKIKTFTEMMEERAQKPRAYNLAIYVDNSDEEKQNSQIKEEDEEETDCRANRDSVFSNDDDNESTQNNSRKESLKSSEDKDLDSFEKLTLDEVKIKTGNHKTTASIDDGFAEEDCNGFGIYTGDSGLESFGSSHRIGDLQDSCSELSTDSGSVYDRIGLDDENRPTTPLGQATTGTDLLEEFSSKIKSKRWPANLQEKEGHVQRSLRMWMKPENKEKDFGFTLKVEKSSDTLTPIVETVKAKSVSQEAGLKVGDEVLAVNGESAIGRSHSSLMFSVKQSLYRGHLDLIVSSCEAQDVAESEESEAEEITSRSIGPSQRRLQNGRSVDDLCIKQRSFPENFRMRSGSEAGRIKPNWSQEEETITTDSKKTPPPIPTKPKFKMAPNGAVVGSSMENLIPIKQNSENEVDADKKESQLLENELDYSRANVMDDTIDSEVDSKEHSMTPLVRTLSGGIRDGAESPNFVDHLKQDEACLSDYNESEIDVDKELEAEMLVREIVDNVPDMWVEATAEPVVTCVQVESVERKNSASSIAEDDIVKVVVPEVNLEPVVLGILTNEPKNSTVDLPISMSNYPLYQENGLNIIFQSHPKDISPVETSLNKTSEGSSQFEEVRTVDEGAPGDQQETRIFLDNVEKKNDVEKLLVDSHHPISNKTTSEHCEVTSSPFDDVFLLADLDNTHRPMEPPKEKPPPPPPPETESDSPEQVQNSGIQQKVNTFKRIKKEIWKRRSDFLGIDPSDDVDVVDVPPPPDMSEILRSERDLERQSRNWLERERAKSVLSYKSGLPENEEIARREKEIIENLELEERKRTALEAEKDDQELVSAENKVTPISRLEDDERIQRLQNERRRMEEERIQREEQRMRMEEERLFQEREESLRLKEEHEFGASVVNPETRDYLIPMNACPANQETVMHDSIQEIQKTTAPGLLKEALKLENERLRNEQEALRREREEYNKRLEIERQKRIQQEQEQVEKLKAGMSGRDAVIYASKHPQGFQENDIEHSSLIRSTSSSELSSANESLKEMELLSNTSRPMNKDALMSLGMAPKARIIQNEQWISQQEKVVKRRSDPTMSRDNGAYNQNHWLIQEAEMRRISEQNERQQRNVSRSPERRPSLPFQYASTQCSQTRVANAPPQPNRETLRHIAPRPYQRPPPPPPKPPHGVPLQNGSGWSYRSVTAPSGTVPKSAPSELNNFHRNVTLPNAPACGNATKSVAPTEYEQEHQLSVSGKERCSHCGEPLGRGGAMIIESLQLCYHMSCFCCCVCQAQLGNGTCGTDVRVRNNKLHCQNCYSNDEAGLKFSQV